MKNKLIQYQGGGYPGCFWEWNFPVEVADFVSASQDGLVLGVKRALEEFNIFIPVPCEYCGNENTNFSTGYQGCGGIAIEATGRVCEDCYCSHTCSYCGEFHDELSEIHEEGCSYCRPLEVSDEAP